MNGRSRRTAQCFVALAIGLGLLAGFIGHPVLAAQSRHVAGTSRIAASVQSVGGLPSSQGGHVAGGPPAAPGFKPGGHGSRIPPSPQGNQPNGQDEVAASGPNGQSTDYMDYRGGYIQESPKLFIDYWGNWSLTNDRYNVQTRLYNFLKGVGGSSWAGTMTQYGYNCSIGAMSCPSGAVMFKNPSGELQAIVNDTTNPVPQTPTFTDMQNEAARAAAHFAAVGYNAYGHDVQYVIALPPGHGDTTFVAKGGQDCAWHHWVSTAYGAVSFTTLPYMPDAGWGKCGNGKVNGTWLDGVTIIESHEYAEAVTDPYDWSTNQTYSGWNDSTFNLGENGDKCNWSGGPSYMGQATLSTGTFPVQTIWSNYDRYYHSWGCVL